MFLGAGVEALRFLRVSVGWTWQQVPALEGLIEGGPVAIGVDVPTKDVWRRNRYAAVSVSLGAISLFTKPR